MEVWYHSNTQFPYRVPPGKLSEVSATFRPKQPWLADIVEILPTEAPESAKPLCCYIRTVIFYEHPRRLLYGEDGRKKGFAVHDEIETKLQSNDVLTISGDIFEVRGGTVRRIGDDWVMQWLGYRINASYRPRSYKRAY